MAAFTAAALVIVALIFATAMLLAAGQQRAISRMRGAAPLIKRWGGRILIGVGAWLIALALFADTFADLVLR